MQLAIQFMQKKHYKLRTYIKVQEVNNFIYKQDIIKQLIKIYIMPRSQDL